MRLLTLVLLALVAVVPAVAAQGFWNPPVLVKELSSGASDYYPFISGDNLTARVASSRNDLTPPPSPAGGWHIWQAKRATPHSTFGVLTPEPGAIQTAANDLSPWVMADEKTAYTAASQTGGVGGFDIWEWKRTGVGASWVSVGSVKPVNSPSTDYHVSVTADHLEMYLLANRVLSRSTRASTTSPWKTGTPVTELSAFGMPGVAGDGLMMFVTRSGKIHLTTRSLRTDPWGTPTTLTAINNNTSGTNNRPVLSPDGRQLFFSSSRSIVPPVPGVSGTCVWMSQWTGLTTQGTPRIGQSMKIHVAQPLRAGSSYQVGMAFSNVTGIPVPKVGTIPLDLDALLQLSVGGALPSVFSNFRGLLDNHGEATAQLNIPNIAPIAGMRFSVAAVAFSSGRITYITNGKNMVFNP